MLELREELIRHFHRATDRIPYGADIVAVEGVVRGEHHLEHRGDPGHVSHLMPFNRLDHPHRIESVQDNEGATGEQKRFDRAGHRVLVIERHRNQSPLALVDGEGPSHDVAVPDLTGVGQQHPLGFAGRPRGVGLETHGVRFASVSFECR